jgi:hypothetical protein
MPYNKLLTETMIGIAEPEVTNGTYVDPTSPDVELYDVTPIKVDMAPTRVGNKASGTFKKGQNKSGIRTATTSFKFELLSVADPTTEAPKSGKFLEAAGLRQYTDTNIGFKYDAIPTCNTLSYKDIMNDCGPTPEGATGSMRGAVGKLTITAADVGEPIVCNYELSGVARAEADKASAAPIVPVGFDTTACEKLLNVAFTLGGVSRKVQSFTIDFQTVSSPFKDGGEAEGIDQFSITDGDPLLTITLIKEPVSVQDHYTDQASDTTYATATMSLLNWDFTFLNVDTSDFATGDADGFATMDLTLPFEEFTMLQK